MSPRLRTVLAILAAAGAVGLASGQNQRRLPVLAARVPAAAESAPLADADALAAARLDPADAGALLGYFRLRTLTEKDRSAIDAIIARLGREDFDERLAAQAELERVGPAAVGALRAAASPPPGPAAVPANPEIAYRAGLVLARLEKVPHAQIALAAARRLAALPPPPGAAEVILDYLPLADSRQVADALRGCLAAQAVVPGAAGAPAAVHPVILAAALSGDPARRSAGMLAVVAAGPNRTPAAIRALPEYPRLRAAALALPADDLKFQAVFALATQARDPAAIPALIELLPASRLRAWQAEDFLRQVAAHELASPGAKLPAPDGGDWAKWWAGSSAGIDLAKVEYVPRTTGRLLVTIPGPQTNSAGSVSLLGPDLKPEWTIANLAGPRDAVIAPDGTVYVAEEQAAALTARNPLGQVLRTVAIRGPKNARIDGAAPKQLALLPGGELLVTCANHVVRLDPTAGAGADQSVVASRSTYDIMSAARVGPDLNAVFLMSEASKLHLFDDKGVDLGQTKINPRQNYYPAHLAAVPPDGLLVCEAESVAEYAVKTGQERFKYPVEKPRCASRLINGNTLVLSGDPAKLAEYAPGGKVVWEHTFPAGAALARVAPQ